MPSPRYVVITDLDGTLLDGETYRWDAAQPALSALALRHVDLVLATSKTRAELELLRRALGHRGSFIVENGGALFVPNGFFTFDLPGATLRGEYQVLAFGPPYAAIRHALTEMAAVLHVTVQGFGDLSVEEVTRATGLSPDEAILAQQREYDEPFLMVEGHATLEEWQQEASRRGLTVTRGGRFFHLLGAPGKGVACRRLIEHYRQEGDVVTVGLGDSINDLSLLSVVDIPILVQRPDGTYDPAIDLPRLVRAPGIGPHGWSASLLQLLNAA